MKAESTDEEKETFVGLASKDSQDSPVFVATRKQPIHIPTLDPYMPKLERFEFFSTNQCYYLVGSDARANYRLLKMDRTLMEYPHRPQQHDKHAPNASIRPLADFVTEDTTTYSATEIRHVLDTIHSGNAQGLRPIVRGCGIVGFVRFLDCYYLTLVTRKAKVGSVGTNAIYTIRNTETIPLKPAERSTKGQVDAGDPHSVLLSMWNRGKGIVGLGSSIRDQAELKYQGLYQVTDLSKGFYLSYTYDLTRSLQENFLLTSTKPDPPPPFQEMYAWNYFLTREFEACLDSSTSYLWLNPIIHGSFVQRRVRDYGRTMDIHLIARRSRYFAGPRYLKRGVSEQGKVANDVEHEQILYDESGIFSSYLQMRGSIPTFWTQETSYTQPKPPIELNRVDPNYAATRLHFADLMTRYSSPIVALDLVKQSEKREREVRVGDEFRHAIDTINATIDMAEHKIRYCALDHSHINKHRHLDASAALHDVCLWGVNQTGFFCSAPKWKIIEGDRIVPFVNDEKDKSHGLKDTLCIKVFPMEQNGVLRTNCIDCLDRTNAAQFVAGVEAIGQQLVVMGIRCKPRLSSSSSIVKVLYEMYDDIGDSIALQYGGSEAHKKHSENTDAANPIGKHKELFTSVKRYYSNAFTDAFKQDAANIFLGNYIPSRHSIPLWELGSDYYLHNYDVRGMPTTMERYRLEYGLSWNGKGEPLDDDWNPEAQTVEARCEAQTTALSLWWKHALQAYIQRRMWMHLGGEKEEDQEEEKESLVSYDKEFMRPWSKPYRRPHHAQHTDGNDDADTLTFTRLYAGAEDEDMVSIAKDVKPDYSESLSTFINKYGTEPWSEPALSRYSEHHARVAQAIPDKYIGTLDLINEKPKEEYLRYLEPPDTSSPFQYRQEKIDEFKACLHDYSLEADDVAGIRELSRQAHIGSTIQSGIYEGLRQTDSAIDIATAIQEQFNAMDRVSYGYAEKKAIENELNRRGMLTAGVQRTVDAGIQRFASAQRQYEEILDLSKSSCRRSDLTTSDSMKLYTSMFSGDAQVSLESQMFMLARQPDGLDIPTESNEERPAFTSAESFVKKASQIGIEITSNHEHIKTSFKPLFEPARRHKAPRGFEQINDDMFARKDNKFMVFNGVGVQSWMDTTMETKLSQTEEIILSTFQ